MESKLKKLFEYQRFAENARLAELIAETKNRYGEALDEEALEQVAAAGDFLSPRLENDPNKPDEFP